MKKLKAAIKSFKTSFFFKKQKLVNELQEKIKAKYFSEEKYLEANPDVAAAVSSGGIGSGLEHYQKYGKNEGRKLRKNSFKEKIEAKFFSEEKYLEANPDIAAAVHKGGIRSGLEHYQKYGKNEGRKLKLQKGDTARESKVFTLIDKNGKGLEIGPSHKPFAPKKNGFNVHILDHASAEELRNKYLGQNIDPDNIEEVDFVWKGERFQDLIGDTKCYDWIIASHVIEHVPDLISYFQQCEALLKDGGILSLVVPDKRFCFDYFSSVTSTGNLLDAFNEGRIKPSNGQVFDYFANASKKNNNVAWTSHLGADAIVHPFSYAKEKYQCSVLDEDYIDVHCWKFTPTSFRLLISDLRNLGLINMQIQAEFETGGYEFFASLGICNGNNIELDRFSILKAIKSEKP